MVFRRRKTGVLAEIWLAHARCPCEGLQRQIQADSLSFNMSQKQNKHPYFAKQTVHSSTSRCQEMQIPPNRRFFLYTEWVTTHSISLQSYVHTKKALDAGKIAVIQADEGAPVFEMRPQSPSITAIRGPGSSAFSYSLIGSHCEI